LVKVFLWNKTVQRGLLHLLFWGMFYVFYFETRISNLESPENTAYVAITYLYKLVLQMISAYFLIYFLVPRTLNHKRYLVFGVGVIVTAYIIYFLYQVARINVFEIYFPQLYNLPGNVAVSLTMRMLNFAPMLDFAVWTFTPAAVMGLIGFYKNQRTLAQLQEEKKTMELKLLRNQLNPHFLFNTLNNLYTLSLHKDDRAPQVISRLSGILDYMLYSPADLCVGIEKEVELLDNYIALEQLRYGNQRCSVSFHKQLKASSKIPPLILLTLVENAFKHGVVNETGGAEIDLNLRCDEKMITFKIETTGPSEGTRRSNGKPIGLLNIRSQLNLLYPGRHILNIIENPGKFVVNLELYEV
jgi:two-component system LytT family sensor kinase